jgi:hypothetical protein
MFVVLLNLLLKKIRYWNSVQQIVRSVNHRILPLSAHNAAVKWMFSLRSNCPFHRKIHVYICPLREKFCRCHWSHSSCIFLFYVYTYVCLSMATLTEVFPCFFLSCQANARVKPGKTGYGPHSSKFLCCSMYFCVVLCIVCFVSFSVLFVCICALYYCQRVATQLQLNISYHIC